MAGAALAVADTDTDTETRSIRIRAEGSRNSSELARARSPVHPRSGTDDTADLIRAHTRAALSVSFAIRRGRIGLCPSCAPRSSSLGASAAPARALARSVYSVRRGISQTSAAGGFAREGREAQIS